MWQRSNVFSVDGRFSGTADEKPAEGRQVAVRRPRSLQGRRDGVPGEGWRAWPREMSSEQEESSKGGWELLGWWTPGGLGRHALGEGVEALCPFPIPYLTHLFHLAVPEFVSFYN